MLIIMKTSVKSSSLRKAIQRPPMTEAARRPRPAEVPALKLDSLHDSEFDEDAALKIIPGALSALSWGSSASISSEQCFLKDSVEKHQDDVEPIQLCCTPRTPAYSSKPNLNSSNGSSKFTEQSSFSATRPGNKRRDAEELTEERKLQAVIEQVMVDQLSRAVISDPEQNAVSVSPTSVPPRYRRSLHHTVVKTSMSLTENILSNKLCFQARIISRCGREACRKLIGFYFACDQTLTVYEYRNFGKNRWSALPFIARGVYWNRGRPYCLQDLSQGAELLFSTDDTHLPQSLREQPSLILRVTDVDERAKRALLAQFGEPLHCLSEEEMKERNTLQEIQDGVRGGLRGQAVQTMIDIGRQVKDLDLLADEVRQREQLRQTLMACMGVSAQDCEAVWRIVSRRSGGRLVQPTDVMRAVTGNMNEKRKAIFLKVYVKLDPNKTGSIILNNIEKFYRGKQDSDSALETSVKPEFLVFAREAGRVTKMVSYAEFEDYYEGLSIEVPDDEEYINNLRRTWGI